MKWNKTDAADAERIFETGVVAGGVGSWLDWLSEPAKIGWPSWAFRVRYWLQAAVQRIVIYVGLTPSSGNTTR